MRIAVDMDGTIVDFTTEFKTKIETTFGVECNAGYIDAKWVYDNLTDEQKAQYSDHREIYEDLCGAGFFLNLKPFPGAIEAVSELFDEGHEIYFLTKPLNWDRSAPEKALWLKKYFPGRKYRIIMVDSAKSKHIIDVDVIVDDDKRVLCGDSMAMKICIAQPWNQEFRDGMSTYDEMIVVAADMTEATDIILGSMAPACDEWNRMWCEE